MKQVQDQVLVMQQERRTLETRIEELQNELLQAERGSMATSQQLVSTHKSLQKLVRHRLLVPSHVVFSLAIAVMHIACWNFRINWLFRLIQDFAVVTFSSVICFLNVFYDSILKYLFYQPERTWRETSAFSGWEFSSRDHREAAGWEKWGSENWSTGISKGNELCNPSMILIDYF